MKTPLRLFVDGEAAVLYFFILSGYVLTLSLKNSDSIPGTNYINYIFRRGLRIYPAFLFTLILSYLILKVFPASTGTWLDKYWQSPPHFVDVLKQSILVFRFPNSPELRYLPHDWTLSIEMALSFLLPVLALAARKNSGVVLLVVFAAVKMLGLDPFVFDFSLGIFIAQSKDRLIRKMTDNRIKTISFIIALALICLSYVFPETMTWTDKFLIHHKSWGLALLLLIILSSTKIQSMLSFKAFVFLGRISYSFYLTHLIVLFLLLSLLPNLNPAVFLIIYAAVTTLISALMYVQIEKPYIKMGKRQNFILSKEE